MCRFRRRLNIHLPFDLAHWTSALLRRRRKDVCPAVRFSRRARTPADWQQIFRQLAKPSTTPKISIITPLWNTKPRWLAEAAVSVLDQTCPDWEWCLVDDGSIDREFEPMLETLQEICPTRIRVKRCDSNGGIADASNEGLRLARTPFVCFLDHDDLLHPDAIESCLALLDSGCDAVYTDSNKASEDGVCDEPFDKPDWSPEYFRSVMYVGHLLCVRRAAALEAGGFDGRFDGVQDFEFFLRYSERYGRIAHVPRVLYHWRRVEGGVAASLTAKPGITRLQRQAVSEQLTRLQLNADAVEGPGEHRVTIVPRAPISCPRISIHLATRQICDDSSDFLLFLAPGIEPVTPDWIAQLLYHASQRDVGAVGAMLLNPDHSVRHAGIALGGPAVAQNMTTQSPHARECSAVSLECLLIRRDLFEAAGGAKAHYHQHQDVDLCLRLRAMGKRNVVTPRAVLICHNKQNNDDPIDRNLLLDDWEELIAQGDPYFRLSSVANPRSGERVGRQ